LVLFSRIILPRLRALGRTVGQFAKWPMPYMGCENQKVRRMFLRPLALGEPGLNCTELGSVRHWALWRPGTCGSATCLATTNRGRSQ
jgi:hypothetical protein